MDGPLPDNLVPAWEDFLARPRTLDDLFAHPVLFPLQRRKEMDAMHTLARKAGGEGGPRVVMEIGADKGGSVWAWLKALPTVERFVACEVRGIPYADAFEAAFPAGEGAWLGAGSRSPGAVEFVHSFLLHPGRAHAIDVLFLDGDKSFFYEDFQAYLPLMSPNGVVIFHDVQDPGPMRDAWQRASKGRRSEYILDRTEAAEALLRARKGIPPVSSHEGWLRHWAGRSCGVGVVWLGGEPDR